MLPVRLQRLYKGLGIENALVVRFVLLIYKVEHSKGSKIAEFLSFDCGFW